MSARAKFWLVLTLLLAALYLWAEFLDDVGMTR